MWFQFKADALHNALDSTDCLRPPPPPVLHTQNDSHPSSPSEKRIIPCFRCGNQCKGEVLRVQSNHFHIKCFTCKGQYHHVDEPRIEIGNINSAVVSVYQSSVGYYSHWCHEKQLITKQSECTMGCCENLLACQTLSLWFSWKEIFPPFLGLLSPLMGPDKRLVLSAFHGIVMMFTARGKTKRLSEQRRLKRGRDRRSRYFRWLRIKEQNWRWHLWVSDNNWWFIFVCCHLKQ